MAVAANPIIYDAGAFKFLASNFKSAATVAMVVRNLSLAVAAPFFVAVLILTYWLYARNGTAASQQGAVA